MRILIFADSHPHRLGDSYKRAIVGLGHEIAFFDTRVERFYLARWLQSRIGYRLTLRSARLRRIGALHFNRRLLAAVEAFKPEILFAINGEFLQVETLQQVRRGGVKVVLFHPDNPLPPNYANRPETLDLAGECDLYLVWGEALVEELRSRGIRQANFLPFAWDPAAFPYQSGTSLRTHDVVFVGGWDPAREELLDEVARTYCLRIWGPHYWRSKTKRSSAARACWQGNELTPNQSAHVAARACVTLNVVRGQHVVHGRPDGVIMRTFEVPGAGGFLLSTFTPTAARLLPEGQFGAYFEDISGCLERIDHFLTHRSERDRIAKHAHEEVVRRHLYTHRFEELLAMLP